MEVKAIKINGVSVKAISKTDVPTSQMRDLIARLGFKGQSANYYYGSSELVGTINPLEVIKGEIWEMMRIDKECMEDGSKYLGRYPSLAKTELCKLEDVDMILRIETIIKKEFNQNLKYHGKDE